MSDPTGSCTPPKDLGSLDRWSLLDPPLPPMDLGPWILGSTWILHRLQGSVATGLSDPSGSCTPPKDLWPLDRWILLDLAPLPGIWVPGSSDPPGFCTPYRDRWPLDCRIHLDHSPLPRICGLRIVGAFWILHPLPRIWVPGSSDPLGSCTSYRDRWPLDCRIHLDHSPLPRMCGLSIVGSFWILHHSQGSGSLDPWIRLDPAPLTGICGLWVVDP